MKKRREREGGEKGSREREGGGESERGGRLIRRTMSELLTGRRFGLKKVLFHPGGGINIGQGWHQVGWGGGGGTGGAAQGAERQGSTGMSSCGLSPTSLVCLPGRWSPSHLRWAAFIQESVFFFFFSLFCCGLPKIGGTIGELLKKYCHFVLLKGG